MIETAFLRSGWLRPSRKAGLLALATLCAAAGPACAETGLASFYGRELAGNRTASGEKFNPAGYTAAHRRLPFGTVLRVTNLANGRSVVVRVNDRGPFIRSRVIDVSLAAAKALGFSARGTTRVKLERM
jgi:rare lipoprotein A